MSGKLSVTARQRRTGIVYDVYFRHADERIRFTISDASSYADAHERAKQIQEGVLAGRLAFRPKRQRQYASGTFGSFRPMYEKELKAEKLVEVFASCIKEIRDARELAKKFDQKEKEFLTMNNLKELPPGLRVSEKPKLETTEDRI